MEDATGVHEHVAKVPRVAILSGERCSSRFFRLAPCSTVQITHQGSGDVALVSSSAWKCLTIHKAPLNKECASSNPDEDCKYT